MGSLNLRDFPEDLHSELKAEAALCRMTLPAYIASVLRKAKKQRQEQARRKQKGGSR